MATTIPHKILANGERLGAAPAYHAKRDGIWHQTSWQQYAHEVRQAGAGFLALGVEPSTPVAMLGFNRPEWVIFDVGAMAVGAVPAGIYTTSSPDEVAYVLNHSEAPVVLVENESQWEKVRVRRDQLPHLRQVVMMSGAGPIDDPMVMSWEAFMSAGDQVAPARVQERLDRLSPDDLGTLIYTSGTTGPPKAVMLSHHNLAWTSGQANDMIGVGPTDRVLSYLPLSHIAEQSFTISGPAHNGYQVFYAESIERLPQNLLEVRPTIFFAVPRVWEKFQAGIKAKLGEARGIKAKLAGRAMAVGRQVAALRNQGRTVPALLDAQYQLFDRLVYGKVKEAIGLGEAKFMVSGAAPVAPEVLEFLAGLGMTVYEVYGQSEDTGPTSFNVPGKTKFGSVGPNYPGVEVKIAEDGEILVRGDNVFMGYYRDADATAETLRDGWLHSGDLGEIDDEGFLFITGRKKDIIITAGGKNVAPKLIEGALKSHALVSEAVLIGDRRKYLTALITLDPAAATAFLAERGQSGPAPASAVVQEAIQAAVDTVNAGLARAEQVKKFTILPRELSIEQGELTPTLKVKRTKVGENFADAIERMYQD